jgi:hypothetical protein
VTAAGLVGIAGAISYSHMRELAVAHGEAWWQGHAFRLSVDGIEIVASLVLLADRRSGHRSGWLPWAALAAGTMASLAANVAAAGADLEGRKSQSCDKLCQFDSSVLPTLPVRTQSAPMQQGGSR